MTWLRAAGNDSARVSLAHVTRVQVTGSGPYDLTVTTVDGATVQLYGPSSGYATIGDATAAFDAAAGAAVRVGGP